MPKLRMSPEPGTRLSLFVGDRVRFHLAVEGNEPAGARAFLRTNLTRAEVARREVVARAGLREQDEATFAGASWRDLPLDRVADGHALDLALVEVGHFRGKVYLLDDEGRQHWPEGADVALSVHPDQLRSGNVIYCAFVRSFGAARTARATVDPEIDRRVVSLEDRGYTVIPRSGTLRELTAFVPHIFDVLGCRVLHLLPVGPTPTTYARMGRFGSPYAQLDLAGIDPALVEHDRRTTAVDQFVELADAVHRRSGLLFLDVVLNHTGWGSRLMDEHPDWFQRNPDGTFHSPGAWGVTWGDLVELDHRVPRLWEEIAESLLTWCRRGVDGFRCDAAYMVPLAVWQYVVARVRSEFPDTTFLVEGLGGAYEATAALLSEGGMQWAYSELFQNHGPHEISGYVDHALRESRARGALVHYAETHDNDRLAKKGRAFSLFRNRLCALSSVSGAYGYTAGVEWLADEKLDVHEARGLAFGSEPNLVAELGSLARLLAQHPCFFDGADVRRVSPDGAPVLVLERTSADRLDRVFVVAGLLPDTESTVTIPRVVVDGLEAYSIDLLGSGLPRIVRTETDYTVTTFGQTCHCLAERAEPRGTGGDLYRAIHARAAFAYQLLAEVIPQEHLGPAHARALATLVDEGVEAFVGSLPYVDPLLSRVDLLAALRAARATELPPQLVVFVPNEQDRVLLLPPRHALLVRDTQPFRLRYEAGSRLPIVRRSVAIGGAHVAVVLPRRDEHDAEIDATLEVRRHEPGAPIVSATIRELARVPKLALRDRDGIALLTNGRGAYARIHADLGAVASKYDALLAANLHPSVPCDRHVFVKRARAWANADGFITALDAENCTSFLAGPPARYAFAVHAGDGRVVDLVLTVAMEPGEDAVRLVFERPHNVEPDEAQRLSITLRLDLEDRGFHGETRRTPETEAHFAEHVRTLGEQAGFVFEPADDRRLAAVAGGSRYHPEPEWSHVAHPIEASRGMLAEGDAYSPGWFEIPLAPGEKKTVALVAGNRAGLELHAREVKSRTLPVPAEVSTFRDALVRALDAFVVQRGKGKTVVAGYPWFLDWGRDTLIVCRGLIASGRHEVARSILCTFAALEDRGTLPNALSAEATADRDTSDAPLLLGLACEEAAARLGAEFYELEVSGGRRVDQVLVSIAENVARGARNGVRMDPETGLIHSPQHFTWMDTQYPAGTPREGYPIEIAAYWIRLLEQLDRLGLRVPGLDVPAVAARARDALELFVRADGLGLADVLHAPPDVHARAARPDDHIRPNQLVPVALGLIGGARAKSIVDVAGRYLLVPGALRSLAPRPVSVPLAIEHHGRALVDPYRPYAGRYEGDEDTRRKPAYHNGTAWVFLLPTYCEAFAKAWGESPEAIATARAVLGSSARLMGEGCIGNLPEIIDGDAPHRPRGCDAQAWSVSETLRVSVWLDGRAASRER